MRIRSAGATALNLLLLLILLLAAGNELLCYELLCCDDATDLHDIVVEASGSGRQIVPLEEEHEDDCLCCGLRSQRVSFATSRTSDPALVIAEDAMAQRGEFFVERIPASHTNRGPPDPLSPFTS